MSTSTTAFVCDCEEWMLSACAGEPFYKKHEGKRYCVLHFPGKEKSADFKQAFDKRVKAKNFDFRGVWFPDELLFSRFDFGAAVNFRHATFNAEVDFRSAAFRAYADFNKATFGAVARFGDATFSAQADFDYAIFSQGADFGRATFIGNAHFSDATFTAQADLGFADFIANFGATTFGGEAHFRSGKFIGHANLRSAIFCKEAYFTQATFRAVADFVQVEFKAQVYFSSTNFSSSARFSGANFSARADFPDVIFIEGADFGRATFREPVYFSFATLRARLDFREVTFGDYVKFAGDKGKPVLSDTSALDLQFARIEKPDHLSFHTLVLRPNWFVNVDPRRFDFTNVEWDWRGIHEEVSSLQRESLQGEQVSSPHRLLAIAFRQLAVNAEENHRYEEASKFRYLAMDALRREKSRGLACWKLSWWYWLASGYGERVAQAFVVLLGIWLLSALLYNHVSFARWEPRTATETDVVSAKRDDVGAPLQFSRALTYSASVMTLQKPEPRPASTAAQTVVLLETILGPVQAALLALAIRRKFMR